MKPLPAIPLDSLRMIQAAKQQYRWRDLLCQKDPFDFALYPMLLWEQKPGTVIEIGTKNGGSALWLADTCRALGLQTRVITIDVKRRIRELAGIEFMQGNGRQLERVLSDSLMQQLPRPLLVIEDADHHYLTTIAVLRFMTRHLRPGEYVVVEDGIVDALHDKVDRYGGGPNRAIADFLGEFPDFEIDRKYCDFFGPNVTWNTNGYLRRRRVDPPSSVESVELGL